MRFVGAPRINPTSIIADERTAMSMLNMAERRAENLISGMKPVARMRAGELAAVLRERARIEDTCRTVWSYAMLRHDLDRRDPAAARLADTLVARMQSITGCLATIETQWARLPREHTDRLASDQRLTFAAHWLRAARAWRPRMLPDGQEALIADRDWSSGQTAWYRLYSQLQSDIDVNITGTRADIGEIHATLRGADPHRRRVAHRALHERLHRERAVRAHVFDAIVADHDHEARRRGLPDWFDLVAANDGIRRRDVDAMRNAVESRIDLAHRWNALKARLDGGVRIAPPDRLALPTSRPRQWRWADTARTVTAAYRTLGPRPATVVADAFANGWIDAARRPGKYAGAAYCAALSRGRHPVVLLNFTGSYDDVQYVAHELGHATHFELARTRGHYEFVPDTPVAETIAVAGEIVVGEYIVSTARTLADQLDARIGLVEDIMTMVWDRARWLSFEDAAHHARSSSDTPLDADTYSKMWMDTCRRWAGPAAPVSHRDDMGWSMLEHAHSWPGSVYAYPFAMLCAIGILSGRHDRGFAGRWLELCRAGYSAPPCDLLAAAGFDPRIRGGWDRSIDWIEAQIDELESLAMRTGRL